MDKKKCMALGLALLISMGMLSIWNPAAEAVEETQAVIPAAVEVTADRLIEGAPAAVLHLNIATDVYAQKYRDYNWIKNHAKDINYLFESAGASNSGQTEALLADCRFYFPMQLIAEKFDEDMDWDGMLQRSYVQREGKRIYMSTIKVGDTPYVKIRDFEILGYKIEYQGFERYALVDMTKI